MKEIIEYIIKFLLGNENIDLKDKVSYGYSKSASVIIKKSSFFDQDIYLTKKSLPKLPLKNLDGIPILYGEAKIENIDEQTIIYADLIASTYFLITRYEECIKKELRDEHGRFIGKESLPYKEGFIKRPIVDEYGEIIKKYLKKNGCSVNNVKKGFNHVYLTHDVDTIWTWNNYYKAFRSAFKNAIKKRGMKSTFLPIKACYNYEKYDPAYTFLKIIELDNILCDAYEGKCTPIYFIMGSKERNYYDAVYMNKKDRVSELINLIIKNNARIGYHVGYGNFKKYSNNNFNIEKKIRFENMKAELDNLENVSGNNITISRNHYLANREPEEFNMLIDLGITEDFTMGYADILGFRLGTCRAVNWIDPINRKVTNLILHPLTVMEVTLEYMGINNNDDAFSIIQDLISKIYSYSGEITLLWHNNSFGKNMISYKEKLYIELLKLLKNLKNI